MVTFLIAVALIIGLFIMPRITLGIILIYFGWVITGIICIVWGIVYGLAS